jgi:hypothetical protein
MGPRGCRPQKVMGDFYVHEFWRFVFLPMQRGASFNLEAVKAEIDERVKAMKARTE